MTEPTNALAIVSLPPSERAAIALGSKTAESQLRAMLDESADITEVKDKYSRTMAHNAGMKLKGARVAIEKTGKAARDDANAFAKAVIDEEKRLKSIIADEEARLFALRDEYDRKIEAERLERERLERARIQSIRERIELIQRLPADSANDSSEEIADTMNALTALEIDDSFDEFRDEAIAVKAATVAALQALWQTTSAREAEAARLNEEAERLAAERAELERMRAEIAAQKAALQAAQSAAEAPKEETQVDMFLAEENTAATDCTPAPDILDDDAGEHGEDAPQDTIDAQAFVRDLASYSAEQFYGLADKVTAVGFEDFAQQLRQIADEIISGAMDARLMNADWSAMGMADKRVALASHAGVSLIFGDEAMGGSTLRQAAE